MRFLFYLVHPAKFQFHKEQIKELKKRGHTVDILINSKDVLEDLLKEEGFEYTNLFPKSRKIKGLHVYIAAIIGVFRTLIKLLKFTKGKKYDLFIGDLLTILGIIKRTPSLYPTDDVLRQVPGQAIFLLTCSHIIAPKITELGLFNKKKVYYDGYKALCYIHPNVFNPSPDFIDDNLRNKTFFLIRCTGFAAHHDIGRQGINDSALEIIVNLLKNYGEIIISSERELPEKFKIYEFRGYKKDIFHYMAYAKIFIGDSVTMCTEAALLGTPTIEYDDYWHEMEQLLELKYKYGLIELFQPPNIEDVIKKIVEILENPEKKSENMRKRDFFLKEKIDVNKFLIWFYENYPESYKKYKENPFIQYIIDK